MPVCQVREGYGQELYPSGRCARRPGGRKGRPGGSNVNLSAGSWSVPSNIISAARASSRALSKSAPPSGPASSSCFRYEIREQVDAAEGSIDQRSLFCYQAATTEITTVRRSPGESLVHERVGSGSSLLGGLDDRGPLVLVNRIECWKLLIAISNSPVSAFHRPLREWHAGRLRTAIELFRRTIGLPTRRR